MSAVIRRLHTRPVRLRQDERARLRDALVPFVDDDGERPEVREVAGKLLAAVDVETASANRWSFVMLSPGQNLSVVRFLRARSARPAVAMELWAQCFQHLRMDTGEVVLSRHELARDLGVSPKVVSELVGELVRFGALSRAREGRFVRYFMNPNVGTHLSGAARDEAQRAAPAIEAFPLERVRRRRVERAEVL